MKKYWKLIVSFVIALALSMAVTALGARIEGEIPGAWAYVLLALLIALFVGNVLVGVKFHSRMRTKDAQWFHAKVDALKERAEADPKRFLGSMSRAGVLAWCYYWAVFALVLGMEFFVCASFSFDPMIFWSLIAVYLLTGLIRVLLPGEKQPEPEYILSREEYPALYAVAEEAARRMALDRQLRLCLGGDTGVALINGKVTVMVSTPDADLLTRSEMLQIMIHEMAHVKNQDTDRIGGGVRMAERWARDQGEDSILLWSMGLLSLPDVAMKMWFQVYHMLSGRYAETEADRAVAELGDTQEFINALAKSGMYHLFAAEPSPEIHAMRACEEQPMGENRIIHDRFRRELEKKEDYWRHLLSVELPARVDTHPIFRFRAEAMGVERYRVDRVETDEGWLRDVSKLMEYEDSLIREAGKERYAELHKGYLEREQVMKDFREAEEPLKHYDDQKLYEAAQAFYVLDNDTALAILDELLARNQANAYAQWLKGRILLDRDEDEGAEYLFRAAENQNFVDPAMELVAVYALRHGKQELLDRYRSFGVRMAMDAIDYRNEVGGLGRGEEAVANDLLGEKAKQVLEFMVSRGPEDIAEILTVKKLFGAGQHSYQYYVRFKEGTNGETIDKVMDEIFLFLDMEEEDFALDIPSEKQVKILKKKVPGCSVYRAE